MDLKDYLENSDLYSRCRYNEQEYSMKVSEYVDKGEVKIDIEDQIAYLWSGLGHEWDYALGIQIKSLGHLRNLEKGLGHD